MTFVNTKHDSKADELENWTKKRMMTQYKLNQLRLSNELRFHENAERDFYEQRLRYETATKVMNDLRTEVGTLQNTVQILQSRMNDVKQYLNNQEEEAGVTGYREVQAKLEEISEETADLDEIKGQKLEEISSIINQMSLNIQDKKETMKPKVRNLLCYI